jgi:hypothetical protein
LKFDEKKNQTTKTKPFLDTKEKPCRDDTQKNKNTVCVCNSEMCSTYTHSPETKKDQRRSVYNKDGKKRQENVRSGQ